MDYFGVESRFGANDCDVGVGIETVENSASSNLKTKPATLAMLVPSRKCDQSVVTHLSTADDKHLLVLNLPCQDETAPGLHFGKTLDHDDIVRARYTRRLVMGKI